MRAGTKTLPTVARSPVELAVPAGVSITRPPRSTSPATGTLPPRSYETPDGIRVGAWLHNQRMSLRGHRPITADRVEQLKGLHFSLRDLAAAEPRGR